MSEHSSHGHSHADDIEHLKRHRNLYLWIFGALLVLTVVTVWAATLDIDETGHVVVALLIASVKATLVAGFFMHLTSEKSIIHKIMSFTFFFFLGMVFLCVLAWLDHTEHIKLPGF